MDPFIKFETREIQKGKLLQTAGTISKYGYKVVSGCLKVYLIDRTGKERIFQFIPEDWIFSDFDSHFNKIVSIFYIEAIEPSEVILIPFHHMEDMSHLTKEELVFMNTKFRNNIISANRRLIGLLTADAQTRYLEFIETYPQLIQRIPLKLVASYLGITPEYLSDLRKKMTQK